MLDAAITDTIVRRPRTDCSPRHVPDEIHHVPDIPYTLSAKKMEIPIRRILQGFAPDRVAGRDTMRNPDAVDWFIAFRAVVAEKVGVARASSRVGGREALRRRMIPASQHAQHTAGSLEARRAGT